MRTACERLGRKRVRAATTCHPGELKFRITLMHRLANAAPGSCGYICQ
jgi:hypothetical protein